MSPPFEALGMHLISLEYTGNMHQQYFTAPPFEDEDVPSRNNSSARNPS